MTNRLDNEFRFHQSALALRAERQQVLASNIANADTPNFKARDFDFRNALMQALDRTASGTDVASSPSMSLSNGGGMQVTSTSASLASALQASHPAHLTSTSAAGSSASGAGLLYRMPRQDSIDGNTVELDAERAQFADNAVRYEASISAVNSKLKSLLSVISGQ